MDERTSQPANKKTCSQRQSVSCAVVWSSLLFWACLICTFWTERTIREHKVGELKAHFNHQVQQSFFPIQQRLNQYEEMLRGTQGLFAASKHVERKEWKAYVSALKLEDNHPGLRRLGFIAYVPHDKLSTFIADTRADDAPAFSVRPPAGGNLNQPADHFIIKYITPLYTPDDILGYDFAGSSARLEAMWRAARGGSLSITAKIELELAEGRQTGVTLYMPVYSNSKPHDSEEERLAAVEGWIAAPLQVKHFMQSIRQAMPAGIGMRLYDGEELSAESILYDDGSFSEETKTELQTSKVIEWGGRKWSFQFKALPDFMGSANHFQSYAVTAVGIVISFLFTALTWSFAGTRAQAEKIAQEMTARLAEQNEIFRYISTSAQDAIMMTDHDGNIIFWNKAAEKMLGYTWEEVKGKNLHRLLAPARYQAAYFKAFPHWQATGQGAAIGKTLELSAVRKDRAEILIELSLSSVRVKDKWQAIGIVRDITSRKQAEEAMRKAKEAADEASRIKSQFLANMSHEIRTPMNGIIGAIDLVLQTAPSAEQREYLQAAQASAESLMRLLNDLLEFSKAEAGKIELVKESFNLQSLIAGSKSLAIAHDRPKQTIFIEHIEPEVPLLLVGDPFRLSQILNNLLSNALKFTKQRGVIIVYVSLEKSAGRQVTLHFSVSDNGIGIPPEKLALIFDAFTQADNTITRQYGGTGLGLAICKKLVHLMGGKIWVNSKPGIGTCFHFTVSLERAPLGQKAVERAETGRKPTISGETRPQPEAGAPESLDILLVEDNPINRKLAMSILKKRGCRVTTAADGREAVEQSTQRRFDLILMDCQMPVMSGFEATAIIRKAEQEGQKRVPIVAMTAYAMDGDREKCLAAGMDDYLSKPFKAEQLNSILEKWCKNKKEETLV